MTWPRSLLVERMEMAVEYCVAHVKSGGLPFVGVVVDADGHVSDFGTNRVYETGDPMAHAEIVAMREVLATTGRPDLSGAVLLATGEPCGLCYRFAIQRRIERVYVAVDARTVAQWGFDYRDSYRALNVDSQRRNDLYRDLLVPRGLEPFEDYLRLHRFDPPVSAAPHA